MHDVALLHVDVRWRLEMRIRVNKSTQTAQAHLAKAAHYPHIAWIPLLPNVHR